MSVFDPEEMFSHSPLHSPLSTYGYRLVEHQGKAATTELVDTLNEQYLLEQLLDETKPPYRPNTQSLHYLLRTPFRYPPLGHGSRFGTRQMSSFFYASEDPLTCLAEVAYYRFVFLSDMRVPYAKPIRSTHEMFRVRLRSDHATDLTTATDPSGRLTDPADYRFAQAVGAWLIENGTDLIQYSSARRSAGVNLAAATPSVLWSRKPEQKQTWFCHTTSKTVSFAKPDGEAPLGFPLDQFLADGLLPRPA